MMGPDSLNNFFDKANNKVQSFLPNLLGLTPIIRAQNHSGRYFGPDSDAGVFRTNLVSFSKNPSPDIFQRSPTIPLKSEPTSPPGFTPVEYYTRDYETFKEKIKIFQIQPDQEQYVLSGYSLNLSQNSPGNRVDRTDIYGHTYFEESREETSRDFLSSLQNNHTNWPGGEIPTSNTPFLLNSDTRGSFQGSNVRSTSGRGTPYENEDPVFFGFSIKIDTENSPLFNGEIKQFFDTVGGSLGTAASTGYTEVFNRAPIYSSFCKEIQKYFDFTSTPNSVYEQDFFGSRIPKKHYVKKIENLDKLVEANTADKFSSFVKYRTDTLKLTFYEDITLSTGTLMNLYKLLYWSRIRGKGVIPENLLRFDCEIIVSELRNMSRVRSIFKNVQPTTTQPGDVPKINSRVKAPGFATDEEVINSAVSGQTDKELQSEVSSKALEVIQDNLSRYRYKLYECQLHIPSMPHPTQIDLSQPLTPADAHTLDISFKHSEVVFERFDYNNYSDSEIGLNNGGFGRKNEAGTDGKYITFDNGKDIPFGNSEKITLNSRAKIDPIIAASNTKTSVGEYGQSEDFLNDLKRDERQKNFREGLNRAVKNLAFSSKRIALNETQRILNDRFRLLNNSIDKIRSAYGLGKIGPPTNVYSNVNPGSAAFKNALRNFAGDVGSSFLDLIPNGFRN